MPNDLDTTVSCSKCFVEVRASNQQQHLEWHTALIEQTVAASKRRGRG